MWNLPNILTMARIFLIIPILLCFFLEPHLGPVMSWSAFVFYVIASITDFFDGMIARKFNMVTPFGTFLDPISDKIFVGALLVLLVGFGRLDGLMMIPVIAIFTREFLISGLREFLGPHDIQMPVTQTGEMENCEPDDCSGLSNLSARSFRIACDWECSAFGCGCSDCYYRMGLYESWNGRDEENALKP